MTPLRLFDLFLRPRRFFTARPTSGSAVALVAGVLLYGLGTGITRLEHQAALRMVLKARGIVRRRRTPFLESVSVDWLQFWGHAALTALVAAALLWTVGTWWFRLRARWSGAPAADMGTAREIYVWSGIVLALPSVLLALAQTAAFPSFRAAWTGGSLWALVLLVFPLWSVLTSYAGVRALLPVNRNRAILWFLVLPCLLYAVAFIPLAASILHMQQGSGPAKSLFPSSNST